MKTSPEASHKNIILTGVKPTGKPHLGNYVGAIRPAIELASQPGVESWLFIADYHSLNAETDPKAFNDAVYEVAATWLACGLDPKKTVIYRQSDIPEGLELNWILACMSSKGLMNRAHAYKAKVQENQANGKEDLDFGVNMGLFTYPILMSADILMFNATHVPVGEDQVQHIEIARDLAEKFNRTYGEVFTLPKAITPKGQNKDQNLLPGIDGRKMSKSYGNHIPLFEDTKTLRKQIMKIVTDSLPPEAPKDPDASLLFDIFKFFATPEQIQTLADKYRAGIGWGYVKQDLYELLESVLASKRESYDELIGDKDKIDKILNEGAEKARVVAKANIKKIRKAIGIER